MKILWISNAPWAPTGYGTQTAQTVPALRALGHEMGIYAFYGLEGGTIEWDGIPIYGATEKMWLDSEMPVIASKFGADLIITLIDVWPLGASYRSGQFPWAPWAPVDHVPIPPGVADVLRTALVPIAYSRFGYDEMARAGLFPMYIPHALRLDVYRPLPDRGKLRTKYFAKSAQGNLDTTFICGVVAANKGWPSRKSFQEILEAWKLFIKMRPGSLLYLHTIMDQRNGGADLMALLNSIGLTPENVVVCDQGLMTTDDYSTDDMVELYNCFDVLLNPAMGEGFGLTPLEAQACGTPAIVGDWTAMPELNASGWLLKEARRFWTPQRSWQFLPNPTEIVDLLLAAHDTMGNKALRSEQTEFAQQYDIGKVADEYWSKGLAQIERIIK